MNLQRLIGNIEALSARSCLDAVHQRVALGGLRLIAQSFRTSTDPYGVAWPKLKHPRKGGPVEVKTGAMRDGIMAGPMPGGVRFTVPATYAGFQHFGTKTNPQRRLLPVPWLGIPQAWRDLVSDAYLSVAKQVIG